MTTWQAWLVALLVAVLANAIADVAGLPRLAAIAAGSLCACVVLVKLDAV